MQAILKFSRFTCSSVLTVLVYFFNASVLAGFGMKCISIEEAMKYISILGQHTPSLRIQMINNASSGGRLGW